MSKLSPVKQQLSKHLGFKWFWEELKTRNTDEKFIHCSRYLQFISDEDAEMLLQRLNSTLEYLLLSHGVDVQKMLDITNNPLKRELLRLRRELDSNKELSAMLEQTDNLLDL
jgi:hypothetical protein